jgi:hypothetical protein
MVLFMFMMIPCNFKDIFLSECYFISLKIMTQCA